MKSACSGAGFARSGGSFTAIQKGRPASGFAPLVHESFQDPVALACVANFLSGVHGVDRDADFSVSTVGHVVGGGMRLREAMIAAIRHNATIGKPSSGYSLCIKSGKFYNTEYRYKYNKPIEIRLTAADCLADDWYLVKDGGIFVPE